MNKKIKVIELFDIIAKGNDIPAKVEYIQKIYEFDLEVRDYISIGDKESLSLRVTSYDDFGKTLNSEVEILEDEEANDISSLNAFKLMEASYMAKCLDKNSREEFMEHLKQSEVEIVHKIEELIEKVNKLDKKINKEE